MKERTVHTIKRTQYYIIYYIQGDFLNVQRSFSYLISLFSIVSPLRILRPLIYTDSTFP